MFITPAYAQTGSPMSPDFLMSLLPFVLIFAIMYFLLIRPQQKKVKEHKAMVEALRRGDVSTVVALTEGQFSDGLARLLAYLDQIGLWD